MTACQSFSLSVENIASTAARRSSTKRHWSKTIPCRSDPEFTRESCPRHRFEQENRQLRVLTGRPDDGEDLILEFRHASTPMRDGAPSLPT